MVDNQINERVQLDNIIRQLDLNIINSEDLTIIDSLAAGGMGKVLLCDYYGMKVIVKTLYKLSTKDYTTEILNSYKFRHPNIPKFLGIYNCTKNYGLVFEAIDGITLNKTIQLEKMGAMELSFLQKVDFMIQLCSVVELLHDHELIHRDLKTANIMIDNLGNLKLLDFGIAIDEKKAIGISLNSSDFALTPTYIPPEILLQNEDNDTKTNTGNLSENNEKDSTLNFLKEKSNASFQRIVRDCVKNEFQATLKSNLFNTGNFNFRNSLKVGFRTSNLLTTNVGNRIRNTVLTTINNNNNIMTSLYTKKSDIKGFLKNIYDEEFEDDSKITITNKFDIWTIGLIISEFFTHIKPWSRNEKESRLDHEIRALIHKGYPFFTPKHNKIKDPDACEAITNIIKDCTIYDPEKRPNAKQIKLRLEDIFHKEMIKEKQIVEQKYFIKKYEKLESNQILMFKKAIMSKNNKEEDLKKRLIEKLGSDVLFMTTFKESSMFKKINLEDEILEAIENTNLIKKQNIAVLKNKLFTKIQIKNKEINDINSNNNKEENIKKFSTYNESDDTIIICKFPNEELQTIYDVTKRIFGSKKAKYRNPFCLNFKNYLFMIGGLLNEENQINHNLVKIPKDFSSSNFYNSIYGNYYFPTKKCFYFDYITNKLKILPNFHSNRYMFSVIYVSGILWLIGGGNKKCEILKFEEYLDNKENENYLLKWNYNKELAFNVNDPILINFDKFIIVIDANQNFEKLSQDGLVFQYINTLDDDNLFKVGVIKNLNNSDFLNIRYFFSSFIIYSKDDKKLTKKNTNTNDNMNVTNNSATHNLSFCLLSKHLKENSFNYDFVNNKDPIENKPQIEINTKSNDLSENKSIDTDNCNSLEKNISIENNSENKTLTFSKNQKNFESKKLLKIIKMSKFNIKIIDKSGNIYF